MMPDYSAKYRAAAGKYKSEKYDETIDAIVDLMLNFFYYPQQDTPILEALKLAITSYHQIDPIHAAEIVSKHNGDLLGTYFATVRDYQNRKEEKNDVKIQSEIHRIIPLDIAWMRDISAPECPLESKTFSIGNYEVALTSAQGAREYMEDAFLIDHIEASAGQKVPLFALMDGHGGSECSQFVQQNLSRVMQEEFQKNKSLSDQEIYNTLCRTCLHLHEEWKSLKKTQLDWSGTTLIFAIILEGKTLWVANVGDSRVLVGNDTEIYQLSEDAKASKKHYQDEILARGGVIISDRVDGNLDMTRSIGDLHHPSIWPRPQISKFDLGSLGSQKQKLMIMASDGLWNVIGSDQAIPLAYGKPLPEIAEELKSTAYALGSLDNVTIIVVKV